MPGLADGFPLESYSQQASLSFHYFLLLFNFHFHFCFLQSFTESLPETYLEGR